MFSGGELLAGLGLGLVSGVSACSTKARELLSLAAFVFSIVVHIVLLVDSKIVQVKKMVISQKEMNRSE